MTTKPRGSAVLEILRELTAAAAKVRFKEWVLCDDAKCPLEHETTILIGFGDRTVGSGHFA